MNKDQKTEARILEAAIEIFQQKGFAATRMQDIADRASINKAMLHYYFRSKQKLFDRVFQYAIQQFFPGIVAIISGNGSAEAKIRQLVEFYLDMLQKNPRLPGFIIHEIQQNEEHFLETVVRKNPFQPARIITRFVEELQAELNLQGVSELDARQLFVSLIAMIVFPFVARPMVMGLFELDSEAFEKMMSARKTFIPLLFARLLQGQAENKDAEGGE